MSPTSSEGEPLAPPALPRVEPAAPADAEAIVALLARSRGEGSLLVQPLARVRSAAARDELVLVRGSGPELLACAQLHRRGRSRLAELMSVAVDPRARGRGLGRACVLALLERASAAAAAGRLDGVWLATTWPRWFARLGFVEVPRSEIPWPELLAKLPLALRQPLGRWPAVLFGPQVFMRWRPGPVAGAPP